MKKLKVLLSVMLFLFTTAAVFAQQTKKSEAMSTSTYKGKDKVQKVAKKESVNRPGKNKINKRTATKERAKQRTKTNGKALNKTHTNKGKRVATKNRISQKPLKKQYVKKGLPARKSAQKL